jgi:transcription termination factor Rho
MTIAMKSLQIIHPITMVAVTSIAKIVEAVTAATVIVDATVTATRGNREEREPVIGEDDVLVPVGGLVDIMDNYSFIRTGGYLPGPNDVYVSQGQVRKYGLRKGDVVTGQVRQCTRR